MNPSALVMLGVVGLGAFAVYRLTKTSAASPQTTAPGAQAAAVTVAPADSAVRVITLNSGLKYHGRLLLDASSIPPLTATREQLVQFLTLLGFDTVNVYMTAAERPAGFDADDTGGPFNRWFDGTWRNPVNTVTLPRPKQLDRIQAQLGAPIVSGMTG